MRSKQIYEDAAVEIIVFESSDIITASNPGSGTADTDLGGSGLGESIFGNTDSEGWTNISK